MCQADLSQLPQSEEEGPQLVCRIPGRNRAAQPSSSQASYTPANFLMNILSHLVLGWVFFFFKCSNGQPKQSYVIKGYLVFHRGIAKYFFIYVLYVFPSKYIPKFLLIHCYFEILTIVFLFKIFLNFK